MSDESRVMDQLLDLLLKWEHQREQGKYVALEELCQSFPDLLPRLRPGCNVLAQEPARSKSEASVATPKGEESQVSTKSLFAGDWSSEAATDAFATIQFAEAGQSRRPPLASEAEDTTIPGYSIVGELGRGGMGRVFRGRDQELGRDVAVKVLLDEHSGSIELEKRFTREARIHSQLQHPGVAPVHELGRDPDGRPYFTMKVVRGQTLAALLKERTSPIDDRAKYLKVFEQVCQTLAYAHAHRVLHRDLKPGNIMVGAYGEVQVMDWGLAKVMDDAAEDGPPESSAEQTWIDFRAKDSETATDLRTGIVGTPAYAAPEQRLGQQHLVDARADVFGLGAILCEILTGQSPYGKLPRLVSQQELTQALAATCERLDACPADAELISLAKRCLAPAPHDRPRDAGVLAGELTAYLESVEARLHQAELDRAAAVFEAREQRRRRKLTLGLAAAAVVVLVLLGGGALLVQSQYVETERNVEASLAKVELYRERLRQMPAADADGAAAAIVVLKQAQAGIEEAQSVLSTGRARDSVHERVDQMRSDIEAELLQLEQEERLFRAVDSARSAKFSWIRSPTRGAPDGADLVGFGPVGRMNEAGAIEQFELALREFGLNDIAQEPKLAAEKIRSQRAAVREALLEALDGWSRASLGLTEGEPLFARYLLDVAQEADENEWRRNVRQWFLERNADKLTNAAEEAIKSRQPPATIELLAWTLYSTDRTSAAIDLLRSAQMRYGDDPWIHFTLAEILVEKTDKTAAELQEAIGCYRAVIALNRNTEIAFGNLGATLSDMNDLDGAIAAHEMAIEINPRYATAHLNLGLSLQAKGDLEGATLAFKNAVVIDPRFDGAFYSLGLAYEEKDNPDAAIQAFKSAIEVNPRSIEALNHLGGLLKSRNDLDGAVAAYEAALKVDPRNAYTLNNLGNALKDKRDLPAAIRALRESIEVDPDIAVSHNNLGLALIANNDLDGAMAEFETAVKVDPNYAEGYYNLGVGLMMQRDPAAAITAFKKAVQLNPRHAAAWVNLGVALGARNETEAAIDAFKAAIDIKPDLTEARVNLFRALMNLALARREEGDPAGAVAAYRDAIEVDPRHTQAHYDLGHLLSEQGDTPGAIAAYRKAIALNPRYAQAHNNLGWQLYVSGELDAAISAYQAAIQADPQLLQPVANLGRALRDKGDLNGAIAMYRRAIAIDPRFADAHVSLGLALLTAKDVEGAIKAFRAGIEINTKHALSFRGLSVALRRAGRFAEARDCLERELKLLSDDDAARPGALRDLRICEQRMEAESRLAAVLSNGEPARDNAERLSFAGVCYPQQRYATAIRFYKEAFEDDVSLADDLAAGHRYNAACCAALAGCGQGVDAAELPDDERAGLRKQSVQWLRADLTALTKELKSGPEEQRSRLVRALEHWQGDPDLAGIRDQKEVEKLSIEEQAVCRRIWDDVAALLQTAAVTHEPIEAP